MKLHLLNASNGWDQQHRRRQTRWLYIIAVVAGLLNLAGMLMTMALSYYLL
jgi:cytochrome c-type biogenesis protein CcmE